LIITSGKFKNDGDDREQSERRPPLLASECPLPRVPPRVDDGLSGMQLPRVPYCSKRIRILVTEHKYFDKFGNVPTFSIRIAGEAGHGRREAGMLHKFGSCRKSDK
jgi:hypothetical protein